VRNYSKVLKIAPAFLLAGTIMLEAQQRDSIKQKEIEQVVLIGYGSKKKTDLTGSVTAFGEKDFNKGAVVNTQQMLQGKAAGVTITNDGAPGGGSTVRIRGLSSLNGNTDPLYVIDGVPITKDGTGGVGNPLNLINPNDIESISVLKDASLHRVVTVLGPQQACPCPNLHDDRRAFWCELHGHSSSKSSSKWLYSSPS
jgi:iron complex outermembrane receptor protein